MAKKRSKKRNLLTLDAELVELAYQLHVNASHLRETVMHINIPASFRMQLLRRVQSDMNLARSLGIELSSPDEEAFSSKENVQKAAKMHGLFG